MSRWIRHTGPMLGSIALVVIFKVYSFWLNLAGLHFGGLVSPEVVRAAWLWTGASACC